MRLLLAFLCLFSISAFGADTFTSRSRDKMLSEKCERCPYVQKVKCNGSFYGILYYQGGYIATPPEIKKICAWENTGSVEDCMTDLSAGTLDCWKKAVKKYGLSTEAEKMDDLDEPAANMQ